MTLLFFSIEKLMRDHDQPEVFVFFKYWKLFVFLMRYFNISKESLRALHRSQIIQLQEPEYPFLGNWAMLDPNIIAIFLSHL